jgi:hypothetical protein
MEFNMDTALESQRNDLSDLAGDQPARVPVAQASSNGSGRMPPSAEAAGQPGRRRRTGGTQPPGGEKAGEEEDGTSVNIRLEGDLLSGLTQIGIARTLEEGRLGITLSEVVRKILVEAVAAWRRKHP